MSIEHDTFHEDDDELEDVAGRSIFSAGWFRALLLLTVMAIGVVVALPYLLNWFEPATHPAKVARPAPAPVSPAVPAAPASAPAPKVVVPAPAPPAPAPIVASQLPPAPPQEKARPTSISSVPRATAAPVKSLPPVAPAKSLPPVQVAKAVDTSVRSDHGAVTLPRAQGVKAKSATGGGGVHWVQVGVFKEGRNADSLARQLRDQGFSIQVAQVTRGDGRASDGRVPAGTYHVVRAGSFGDVSAAVAARASLLAKGHPGFLTEGVAR